MRAKKTSSGRVYYYYDTCAKPRKWLALGADFLEALKKYADYEIEYNEKEMAERINRQATFGLVADRYVKEKLPAKAPRTQHDYLAQLNFLREFFDSRDNPAPINDITTVDIYEYLQWRKNAPVRANREVSLFSVIFNWATRTMPTPAPAWKNMPNSGAKCMFPMPCFGGCTRRPSRMCNS